LQALVHTSAVGYEKIIQLRYVLYFQFNLAGAAPARAPSEFTEFVTNLSVLYSLYGAAYDARSISSIKRRRRPELRTMLAKELAICRPFIET